MVEKVDVERGEKEEERKGRGLGGRRTIPRMQTTDAAKGRRERESGVEDAESGVDREESCPRRMKLESNCKG